MQSRRTTNVTCNGSNYSERKCINLKKILFIIFFISTFLIGCSTENKLSNEAPESHENLEINVVASHLQIPWAINKFGDVFYISERKGTIVEITNGVVNRQQVELSEQLSNASEAGLLGFVLAPDFKQTNLAYAYYTYTHNGQSTNRIVEVELQSDTWVEKRILVDYIPSGVVHHGGRLQIGPDGKLYATTGDAADPELAQVQSSLAGKILRINLDGSIPEDNPDSSSYIYSSGHRNPQGLTWTLDGKLYATEHGNSANDEVNIIEAGANYGWPIIQGIEEKSGYVSPLFTSGRDTTWAPSGVVYYDEKLYVAALRGTALLEFDLTTNKVTKLVSNVGRIRDVWLEDNTLYFVTNNTDGRGNPSADDDQLYKLSIK